jgi:allantoin racemase
MRIIVMNCNTSADMTRTIGEGAARAARPGTTIVPMQPLWGPESAEGYYDSFITAAAVLDRLEAVEEPFDALVMAGFGEHGREGARELLNVPVIDITEAGALTAHLLGHKYGVVTTLPRAVGQIEDSLRTAGLLDRCAAVDAAGLPVLALEGDRTTAGKAMVEAAARVVAQGAEVIVLGCAGMTGLAEEINEALDVPVVDGVAAAVKLAESLVDLGLTTSKINTYAAPRAKARPGWPVSTSGKGPAR